MIQSVAILGSTGSIGVNTLEVIKRHPDKYRVSGLSANQNWEVMRQQCMEFNPEIAVMADREAGKRVAAELSKASLQTQVHSGDEGVTELAASGADIIVCGIVGAVGLHSTLAAVRGGKKVLIANKEPLVMLGSLIMREAHKHGSTVIPLDSEHNAIFQCMPQNSVARADYLQSPQQPEHDAMSSMGIQKIVLTGSGGPFRKLPLTEFPQVTPEQACAHPNWEMGAKVSVDSSTMMNKGLELIEACALFSITANDIEIVVHPQSVIHSMVEYVDGSVLAQLSSPDMRVPIANALGWPTRIDSGARRLSLLECARFDFEEPDHQRFPSIALAREAARVGGTMPAAMNAANEIAVEAFLANALPFDEIPKVVERTMQQTEVEQNCDVENALAADQQARRVCRELLPAGVPVS